MPDPLRLLVVEDDDTLREALSMGLRASGYDVRSERDGTDIARVAAEHRPDLALLDVNLGPGADGFAVARRLLADRDLAVIFLTAADALDDRLAGFGSGADDYITKPFSMSELVARVRAVLRRVGKLEEATELRVADLRIDEAGRQAYRGDVELELTRTEFDLLLALAAHAGKVLTKAQLLSSVWGFDAYDPNVVEVHVSALRRKLEEHGPRIVQTVRGVGYALRT